VSLTEGTKLGVYEITGQIGAGGMGVVYRAKDIKLGRDVAIKTLPPALASDSDRLARFEREAKLLATLNHAHIASIYSLDEHAGTLYLAMELVEGETLEEKLKRGALPLEHALRLALQIAEALEAAHEKGIVHRDLKPANVMVTADGIVKVLDFGLAKAFSRDSNESSLEQSPVLSLAMTQQGLVLGTAGYMSPEQATGQPTDQRADIWAFGVVLYEMLTGLPVFSGESVPHILAEVLKSEPDWERLPKNLHPRLRLALERCLEKKPRDRYHSIADVRVDIETVLRDPKDVTVTAAAAAVSGPARVQRIATTIGLMVLAAGVSAGAAMWLVSMSDLEPVNRFVDDLPDRLELRGLGRNALAVSPDGRHYALNTNEGLYLRRLSDFEGRLIPGTDENLAAPVFSPDGQSIAYVSEGQIRRIAISGGAPVFVATGIGNPSVPSWSADGTMLWALNAGIFRVPATGGTPTLVIEAREGERLDTPRLLPDGDSVLFSATLALWDAADIVVASLATGERNVVLGGGSDARYLPSGHLVYAYQEDLFGVAFDLDTLTVSGSPVLLAEGLMRGTQVFTAAANYYVADDGTLVYIGGETYPLSASKVVWVDRAGNTTDAGIPPCTCFDIALSHDGTRLAYTDLTAGSDIWIWSFNAATRSRMTFAPSFELFAVWSPDDERLYYASLTNGILAQASDGTGVSEVLLSSGAPAQPFFLDGDGNVVFTTNQEDIRLLRAGDESDAVPLLAGDFRETRPALSPDGRWLAYESNENGEFEIYVRPYPDVNAGRWQVSEGGGAQAKWSADGTRLYYLGPTHLMETAVSLEPTFRAQTPEPLFALEGFLISTERNFEVTDDGERFLMVRDATVTQQFAKPRIVIVQNWLNELERLVPTE